MKLFAVVFSVVMFVVLFVAPLTRTIFTEDINIVLQDFEDSNDAEEGEDVKLKTAQEKHFCASNMFKDYFWSAANFQIHLERHKHIFASQKLGVEIPPPKFS